MKSGKSIRIFLEEGKSNGIKTVELSNTNIIGYIVPRMKIGKYLNSQEWSRPGIYMLVGDEEKIYIGEADEVVNRIKTHINNKDYWTECLVFMSKDDYLTKTQVKYLESDFIAQVKEADRYLSDNKNIPNKPKISKADESEVVQFMDMIILILEALGYEFLTPRTIKGNSLIEDIKQDIYKYSIKGAVAMMEVVDNNYVMLKGSTVLKDIESRKSTRKSVVEDREKFVKKGVLKEKDNNLYELMDSIKFSSPSAAAIFVSGGSVNGRKAWKLGDKTLKDIENIDSN
ncbi:GIY-YIG nuclease family protein [Tissierella sp. MB52-C2]|uniref:GIY-YIG nuclease family protein n=1 Tax=Tissierella sp. MB52-C2 TaxID=3070999 RepID=UPI00280AEED7|nr:GIY-YIG nuclease family protein [Tissierella sp. MB52-C2]WMM24763.1 GIY-YIG nuclease family protein [Tissierella sp. MB52-C2]